MKNSYMNNTKNLFENLFIFEIANNHQGDVTHGINIIKAMGEIAKKIQFKCSSKTTI